MHIQAKSKKDAKQLAAAALLEVMLDHVPFQDLLYKSEKQQSFKEIQVWGSSLPVSAVASAVSPRDPVLMCMLHIQCKVPWEVCSISWHVRILRAARQLSMACLHSTGEQSPYACQQHILDPTSCIKSKR